MAKEALMQLRFTAAAFNSIQSIINANDALTIFTIGKRASRDHREAIAMHTEAVRVIQNPSYRPILKNALDSRSEVGYSGRAVKKNEAEEFVKNATKFLYWVKGYIK